MYIKERSKKYARDILKYYSTRFDYCTLRSKEDDDENEASRVVSLLLLFFAFVCVCTPRVECDFIVYI